MLVLIAELEPAAVVYEVMAKRLQTLESHIKDLELKLESKPGQEDLDAVAAALRQELLEHVDDKSVASSLDWEVKVRGNVY